MTSDVLRGELDKLLLTFPSICVKIQLGASPTDAWVEIKDRESLIIYSPLLRYIAVWNKKTQTMKMYATKEDPREPSIPIPKGCTRVSQILCLYDKHISTLVEGKKKQRL